jgi:hypothetical protein
MMDSYIQQMRTLVLVRNALRHKSSRDQHLLINVQPETLHLAAKMDEQPRPSARGPPKAYTVESSGATVTPVQSLSLLHRCAR